MVDNVLSNEEDMEIFITSKEMVEYQKKAKMVKKMYLISPRFI